MSEPKNQILGDSAALLEKKAPKLFEVYEDLYKFVEQRHSKLFSKTKGYGVFQVVDGNIMDAYKNVMHLMLLKEIPGFQFYDEARVIDAVEDIQKKYGLPNDLETIREIKSDLQKILDKHCKITNEKTMSR